MSAPETLEAVTLQRDVYRHEASLAQERCAALLEALEAIVSQEGYEGFGDPASRGAYVGRLARAAVAAARGTEA